jgi:hypothetical protein
MKRNDDQEGIVRMGRRGLIPIVSMGWCRGLKEKEETASPLVL